MKKFILLPEREVLKVR